MNCCGKKEDKTEIVIYHRKDGRTVLEYTEPVDNDNQENEDPNLSFDRLHTKVSHIINSLFFILNFVNLNLAYLEPEFMRIRG